MGREKRWGCGGRSDSVPMAMASSLFDSTVLSREEFGDLL